MRSISLPDGANFAALIDAMVALDTLAHASPRVREVIASLVDEVFAVEWGNDLVPLIEQAAAYVERSQRFVERFESWRAAKAGKPRRFRISHVGIGSPDRPLRRIRGEVYDVNALLTTTVAVRARDRRDQTSVAPRFISTLALAYDGWPGGLLAAVLMYAVRDRRVARRFRSWRRAKAARAASPHITPPPSGSRAHRIAR